MKIGQVAAEAGVNIDTLRYYERRGLLEEPSRRPSGYREYPVETVRIIRFIKRAQDLGFTLDEVEELLQLRPGQSSNKNRARTIAQSKLRDIDEKIMRLTAIRDALNGLVEACACSTRAPGCAILEAFDDPKPLLQISRGGKDKHNGKR